MDRNIIPQPAHTVGERVSGFRVTAVTPIEDIKALCYECVHEVTGARLVHLHCNDRENLYSICFRTPPADSAGEAHILEHSVLAGSRKFPLKDVFKQLSKGSLKTYLNASTYPDKTVYPVCSAVKADYWNLAEVYTDVALRPLMKRETFLQEGHHLCFERPGDVTSNLSVTGVVYNEMKGAMSSPERIVYQSIKRELLPDTPYAFNSGGDPEHIPSLSYEAFVDFHRRYYSPSNALWALYGDISLAEHLAFVGARLEGFSAIDPESEVRLQPRWTEPRAARCRYPVAKDEPLVGKTYVALAWMTAEASEAEETMALKILAEVLLGTAASPLRKALVDSGLGQDVMNIGHWDHQRQAAFAFVLRGSEEDRAARVEKLALDTLRDLADKGLPAELVEAAFHTYEFMAREVSDNFPVELMNRMVEPANYGLDPKTMLSLGSSLAELRQRWLKEPRLFADLILRQLLDNPHRLLLSICPSPTLADEQAAAFKSRMAALKAGMSVAELAEIAKQEAALKAYQEAPDSPEALASLPRVSLKDVPADVPAFPTLREEAGLLCHPVFTNGILSADLAFDVSDLDAQELSLVPFLGKATLGLGAAGQDYAAMATRIALATGGLAHQVSVVDAKDGGGGPSVLAFRGSALGRNIPALFGIFRDLCLSADYADAKRLKDLAQEAYNGAKSALSSAGTQYAYLAAASSLSSSGMKTELVRGFSQVKALKGLSELDAAGYEALGQRLKVLAAKVFCGSRLILNLCADPGLLEQAKAEARTLRGALPKGSLGAPRAFSPAEHKAQGIAVQSQVNFVSRPVQLCGICDPAAPALKALSALASNEYFYKRLRVQGGAYGGYSYYDPAGGGILMLGSYRDPRLADTVADMAGLAAWAAGPEPSAEVLDTVKIGIMSELDGIQSPRTASYAELWYELAGISADDRAAFRRGVLDLSFEDMRRQALEPLATALKTAPKGVVGSREAIEKANEALAARGGEELFVIRSLED